MGLERLWEGVGYGSGLASTVRVAGEAREALSDAINSFKENQLDPTARQEAAKEQIGHTQFADRIAALKGLTDLGDIREAEGNLELDLATNAFLSTEQKEQLEGLYGSKLNTVRDAATDDAFTKAASIAQQTMNVNDGRKAAIDILMNEHNMSRAEATNRVADFDKNNVLEVQFGEQKAKLLNDLFVESADLGLESPAEVAEHVGALQQEYPGQFDAETLTNKLKTHIQDTRNHESYLRKENQFKASNDIFQMAAAGASKEEMRQAMAKYGDNIDQTAMGGVIDQALEQRFSLSPEQEEQRQAFQLKANQINEAWAQDADQTLGKLGDTLASHNPLSDSTLKMVEKDNLGTSNARIRIDDLVYKRIDGPNRKHYEDQRDWLFEQDGLTEDEKHGILHEVFSQRSVESWWRGRGVDSDFGEVLKSRVDDILEYKALQKKYNVVKDVIADIKLAAQHDVQTKSFNSAKRLRAGETLGTYSNESIKPQIDRGLAEITAFNKELAALKSKQQKRHADEAKKAILADAPTAPRTNAIENPGLFDATGIDQVNQAADSLLQYSNLSNTLATPIVKGAEFLAQIQANYEAQKRATNR